MLEKRSTIEGRTLTAREFRGLVSKALELNSTPYLDQVTELFEKARYSENESLSLKLSCDSSLGEPERHIERKMKSEQSSV